LTTYMYLLRATHYHHHPSPLQSFPTRRSSDLSTIAKLQEEIISLKQQEEKFKKQVNSQQRKLSRLKELFNSVDYTIKNFMTTDIDRKSTRLNSSHVSISYAVFCLKKKTNKQQM